MSLNREAVRCSPPLRDVSLESVLSGSADGVECSSCDSLFVLFGRGRARARAPLISARNSPSSPSSTVECLIVCRRMDLLLFCRVSSLPRSGCEAPWPIFQRPIASECPLTILMDPCVPSVRRNCRRLTGNLVPASPDWSSLGRIC